ncbi:alpha/beta hydrolase [Thermogemmatispora sp.]|uniref:alpha/beta hydrolase n=1 Tax=Thermogemmatispora sp. TaxID=1968838 RepID=UPI0035E45F0C
MPPLLSFVGALLGGALLTIGLTSGLSALLIALGLDMQRSQMLTALFCCAGAGFCGGLVGRRLLGALPASLLLFWSAYLQDFIGTQLQPVRDPGGQLEPLNVGALIHTVLMLLALALLAAFAGCAIGEALARVLFDPVVQLWQFLRSRQRLAALEETVPLPQPDLRPCFAAQPRPLSLAGSWLLALLLLASLVLAAGSGDLFLFAPDTGIHTPPVIHTTGGEPSKGTIVKDSFASPSLHGQRRSFLVYLPPSYNTPAGQQRHYPVLYLLHGSPGKIVDWVTGGKAAQSADTLIDLGKIPELIMVFPDGNGRPGATSEWGNSGDGRQLLENYVAFDLVHYIDSHYRTLPSPAERAIGGNSMGGFGAANIAIHHPDVFGFVISLGGYYRAEGSIWGSNPAYRRANSPLYTIASNRHSQRLAFFLGAATKDQPYYGDTLQFAQVLKKLHVPYTLDIEKGYHSWHVWEVQLYHALLWLRWGQVKAWLGETGDRWAALSSISAAPACRFGHQRAIL